MGYAIIIALLTYIMLLFSGIVLYGVKGIYNVLGPSRILPCCQVAEQP